MKILGRPRTWFTVAAVWAALIDLLTLVHLDSSNPLATGLWLAVPVVAALVSLVTLNRIVGVVSTIAYGAISVLAIMSVGIFLGPGLLAMVIGSLLVGVQPPGE